LWRIKLKFKRKVHLKDISRIRIPEDRDLDNCLRLNRNERVADWHKGFLREVFDSKPDYLLNVYPNSDSIYKKLSEYLKLDKNQILLSSGMDGAFKAIWETVTDPGDHVGVPVPTYAMYHVYNKIFDTKLTQINYDSYTLKLKWNELDKFIESKPHILFIPNPNQPVEDPLSIDQIAEISKRCSENGTLLVIDEAYYMFGCETAIGLVKDYDNLVILRTFSKGFGVPGIRLGYMVSNTENIDHFSKTRFAYESNSLSDAVGEYLLDNLDIVNDYIKKVHEGRNYLKSELSKLGLNCNGNVGNYLLIDFGSKEKCKYYASELEERKIHVKANYSDEWGKYMLVTLGPKETLVPFIDVIKSSFIL
tara:strand:+ start:937 stop:2025 length:1089 start_codon:yes stop_codon:yes gene_type:complete